MSWLSNIEKSRQLVAGPGQADFISIISGSSVDVRYWIETVRLVQTEVAAQGAAPPILGVAERVAAGNFFGTIQAFESTRSQLHEIPMKGVSIFCMVFGQGTRLSPFTQTLGGRKSALRTPYFSKSSNRFLRTIDLAILYSSLWLSELRRRDFSGALVKWGDEATIPSVDWSKQNQSFQDIDMVRFVWITEPNEIYAREKEWFVIDNQSGLVVGLIPRQPLESLKQSMRPYEGNRYSLAVNLGSVAISYPMLELASESLKPILRIGAADWDPFVTYLLLGGETENTNPHVQSGLQLLEKRAPGIIKGLEQFRSSFNLAQSRPLRTSYLDFGNAFWIDLGLHEPLRKNLSGLNEDSERGSALRAFFNIPEACDANGNRIISSSMPQGASVRNSLVLQSVIKDSRSVIHNGIVVNSKFSEMQILDGGMALFSSGQKLTSHGSAIAYEWLGDEIDLATGERRTTLRLPQKFVDLISSESIQKYDGPVMSNSLFGNELSFAQAGSQLAELDPIELENSWKQHIQF